jgi:hypothetical protein
MRCYCLGTSSSLWQTQSFSPHSSQTYVTGSSGLFLLETIIRKRRKIATAAINPVKIVLIFSPFKETANPFPFSAV